MSRLSLVASAPAQNRDAPVTFSGNVWAMEENARQFDFDWLVIGSGFGGSVSALRLAEKGYRVGVLECGRRFRDQDFAEVDLETCAATSGRRASGCAGSCALTTFKDVSVVSGCGVGGGSLGYANTLYVPPSQFFQDAQWGDLADWERELAPHYAEAQRMLGVVQTPNDDPADQLLRELRRGARRRRHLPERRPSASSSASPGGPSPTPTSAARAPTAPAACSAGAAWSAARTARRTRW